MPSTRQTMADERAIALPISQFAARWCTSPRTILLRIQEGDLPAFKLGGKGEYRVPLDTGDQWARGELPHQQKNEEDAA